MEWQRNCRKTITVSKNQPSSTNNMVDSKGWEAVLSPAKTEDDTTKFSSNVPHVSDHVVTLTSTMRVMSSAMHFSR
jgi:hypothetical protein